MNEMMIGQIILIAALLMGSAFFSATETAFSSLNHARLRALAEQGSKRAAKTLKLADRYDELLSTILIGNNVVNIAMSSISTLLFVKLLADMGATVSTIVLTVIVLIFGEITPKSLAKEAPERFAMRVTPLVNALCLLLKPVNLLFGLWKKLLKKIIPVKEDRRLTQDELITLVEEAEEGGSMDKEDSELVRSAIEFGELSVEDILTPRVRIEGIEADADTKEAQELFLQTGYSRLPVYEGSLDAIIGVLHQKDLYKAMSERKRVALREIMKTPVYVPQSSAIDDLLRLMQKKKCQLAVVTDEYGGTMGIVTMEDILEELVGEIWDEHDEIEESFRETGENEWTIRGDADVQDWCERFGLTIETDAVTVGGYVMERQEKVPEPGECFEQDGYTVTVTEADGRHVLSVRMQRAEKKTE